MLEIQDLAFAGARLETDLKYSTVQQNAGDLVTTYQFHFTFQANSCLWVLHSMEFSEMTKMIHT